MACKDGTLLASRCMTVIDTESPVLDALAGHLRHLRFALSRRSGETVAFADTVPSKARRAD